MKKLILFFIIVTSLIVFAGCINTVTEAKAEVTPSEFDFGEVVQSEGTVTTTVIVENTGGKPLTIDKLSTSCGCTTAEMDKSELQPGEKREMKITFDPMVHPDQFGAITRVVYLQTNDTENPEIEIDILGNVVEKAGSESNHMDELSNDNEIGPTEAKQLLTSKSLKILDVRTQEEFDESRLPSSLGESILIPHTEITKEILTQNGFSKGDPILIVCRSGRRAQTAYKTMADLGFTNLKVLAGGLIHWEEDNYPLESGTMSEKSSDKTSSVTLTPPTFNFGQVSQAEGNIETEVLVTNNGQNDLIIGEITTSCGCTTGEISKSTISPNESATLIVNFDPNFHKEPAGELKRTVFLPTNDPSNPEIEFVLEAEIIK